MTQQIKVIVEPTGEPVTALSCWRHLRLDEAFDSPPPETVTEAEECDMCLGAAREWAETFTALSLAPKTLELSFPMFPSLASTCSSPWPYPWGYWGSRGFQYIPIELFRGPVQSVVSVVYVDENGDEQTIDEANYALKVYETKGYIFPVRGYAWPSTDGSIDGVRVRYIAGYSLPGDSPQYPLPRLIRSALLLLMADLFENRENTVVDNRVTVQEVPFGVKALLIPHRIEMGA